MLNNENVALMINRFGYSPVGVVEALRSHIEQDRLREQGKEAESLLETMKDFEKGGIAEGAGVAKDSV